MLEEATHPHPHHIWASFSIVTLCFQAWPSTSLASSRWLHLLCAGSFVICGAALNASHPLFANRGYQQGRVVLISIYTALVSMATGVLMGVGVLDEAWPARPLMSMLRHLAFLLIVGGVWSLNWANIKVGCHSHPPACLPALRTPVWLQLPADPILARTCNRCSPSNGFPCAFLR